MSLEAELTGLADLSRVVHERVLVVLVVLVVERVEQGDEEQHVVVVVLLGVDLDAPLAGVVRTKRAYEHEKARVDLALGLGHIAAAVCPLRCEMSEEALDGAVEQAEYELDNLAIVVIDVEERDALAQARHHERHQLAHRLASAAGAVYGARQRLHKAHHLAYARLGVGGHECVEAVGQRPQYGREQVSAHTLAHTAGVGGARAAAGGDERAHNELLDARGEQRPRHLVHAHDATHRPEVVAHHRQTCHRVHAGYLANKKKRQKITIILVSI